MCLHIKLLPRIIPCVHIHDLSQEILLGSQDNFLQSRIASLLQDISLCSHTGEGRATGEVVRAGVEEEWGDTRGEPEVEEVVVVVAAGALDCLKLDS